MKKRIEEIDILKGIAIFFMIFDHIGWGKTVHTYIQSFHMPLFFIVSGYLWNNNTSVKEKIIKRAKQLLLPYCIFAIGYYCINFSIWNVIPDKSNVIKALIFYPTNMKCMPFAPALWFLPCMFLTDVIYTILNKKIKDKKKIGYIILLIAIIGCIYSGNKDTALLPFAIEPTMTALLFFFLGDCLKYHDTFKIDILDLGKSDTIILLVFSVIMAFTNDCVDMRSARYCVAPLYFINGLISTIAYWNIFKIMSKLLIKNPIILFIKNSIMYMSKESLVFVCTNQFLILLIKKWLNVILSNYDIPFIINGISILIGTIFIGYVFNEIFYKRIIGVLNENRRKSAI